MLDGTGAAPVRADVAVQDGRIVAIVPPPALNGAWAPAVIDATGRYVTPGFIDIHTHSDRSILLNPRMESKLRQGVTTEIGGNCGSGVAPARGEAMAAFRRDASVHVELAGWYSMSDYFAHIEHAGIAGNYATWVGHGALRASVTGYAMRAPTGNELAEMTALLHESLDAGAFGYSSGLICVPSGYATTDELAALAAAMASHGGIYASHIRNESVGLLGAVE